LKGIDTNVIIRYLAQDDEHQSAIATRFIETHCSVEQPCFIGHIILCELAWVLESSYEQTRKQIAEVIENLLQVGQLEVASPELVWRALEDYKKSAADFSDHLLARVNEAVGCDSTVTFDKKASKQPAFELLR